MKLFNSAFFALLISFSFTGCVYYSHSAHTNIRQESFDENYEYLKTESLLVGFDYSDKQTALTQPSNPNVIPTAHPLTEDQKQGITPLTDEQKIELLQNMPSYKNSYNSLGIYEPTFLALTNFVIKKYGENAVVGNVVWDVKNTIFIWDFQKIESVTFDVYLKK
jgi:hypothetical protein